MEDIAMYAFLREFTIEDENLEIQSIFLTVPNGITCAGIAGIVFYMFQFTAGSYLELIPVIVFLIGLSDALDGFFARLLNQHTYVGKFLDPLRDKLLVFAVFTNLIYLNSGNLSLLVPLCLAVICEVIIIFQNLVYFLRKTSIRVHWTGKVRFFLTWGCILLILVQIYWLESEYIPVEYPIWAIALLGMYRLVKKTRAWNKARASNSTTTTS